MDIDVDDAEAEADESSEGEDGEEDLEKVKALKVDDIFEPVVSSTTIFTLFACICSMTPPILVDTLLE
ncbi:hypothetical protein JVT61DRAFT_6339 [Boletus reticuloceps]|uniref:Uncharacterized protein n=1 Tax=Boletus reticuloceps TaxID=495285 RepID=A0A8I2YLX7_9AGAM|nr:hypothetical protein JVT61DRAFT_6339 [Boletus reticuloceps]